MEMKEFIEKLAEAIELENFDSLKPETEFRELDEWSSISVILLIAFFDEEFEKEIGETEIRLCNNIQDLYNLSIA